MKKTILITLLSIVVLPLFSTEKIRGYIYDERKDPIIGANVYWEKSMKGVTSDINGYFEIEPTKEHEHLLISYTGYISQSLHIDDNSKELIVYLKEDSQLLDELVVNQRALGTVNQRSSLLQTQKVTYAEICRAACCNLSESFETNPSVDVAYSDAATGAKQVKLLGLSGTYVQMLTENYPNFRGAAAPYGMDYVPGAWMEGIFISKGTSSVKNGYEALAGQINVEYAKPKTMDKLAVNLFASDAMRAEANVEGSILLNKNLSTGFFAHYSSDTKAHDSNKDGFIDYPLLRQLNLMNRWYHEVGDKYIAQYGVKYINEDRKSGQYTDNIEISDPYKISLKTNRGEFFTKQAYILKKGELNESFALIASATLHEQKSMYDKTQYDVLQKNIYASLMYENDFSKMHNLSTGLSLNYDKFDETLKEKNMLQDEILTGAYVQYTLNLNDKFMLLAGIRGDYSSRFGFFTTPRLHLKYNPTEWFHLRGSIGKGYRTANVLAENNYLLASSRKIDIADNLKQEEAWNTGINATFYIPLFAKEMTISGEYYHTRFINQVVVDVDSDPHTVSFYNLGDGRSFSNNAQIEVSYPFFEGFTFTAAYRYTRAMTDFKNPRTGEVKFLTKPLMNDYKGLITASYQTPLRKWQFDVTAQFNGGGRMPIPATENPLWKERFSPFSVYNMQITKFFRNLSIYVGAENLFSFTQENPIIDVANPSGSDFDATMVWGPVHGRKIFAGLRYNIPRY